MEDPRPLMLCMENAAGEEVNFRIEPDDDFHAFLDKARSVLGYDIDLATLTRDQPVNLNENVYQFLLNLELNEPQMIQTLDPNNQEYILDDGTEIRASQIHFDNEDAPIDLTLEKLPFLKVNDIDEENTDDMVFEEVSFKITASPIASLNASPKVNFISGVPFKLVSNSTTGFEAQFTRYLEESNKTYATLNNVTKKNRSPRSLIKDNFNTKEDFRYTREEILNMLKDSPVTSIPYEVNDRKHVRKTDPTRMIQKSSAKAIDIDGLLIADGENRSCFICVKNVTDKLYIFDKEDQKLHRCSPQKIISTQLKVICETCLNDNFQPSRMKGANQFLNSDEYLVIKNNQQYIFQKTKNFKFQTNSIDNLKITDRKFDNVEIGPDGEILAKHIDNDDDVIIVNGKSKESSSDVEIIEAEPEIDKIIDNLEEADEDVKQFLGKYECQNYTDIKELKCRFCEVVFSQISDLISHGETHKHDMENDVVFPCPLCDYGYANFKWLKAHIIAAHEKKEKIETDATNDFEVGTDAVVKEEAKELQDDGAEVKGIVKTEDESQTESIIEMVPELIIKTEVKQECLSSDDEIWIVQTNDEDASGQLRNILKVHHKEEKVKKGHKCYNCSQFFPTAATLEAHKCRRRVIKRKSDDDMLCIPSKEDFIKRAQGRPVNQRTNEEIQEKQRKKLKEEPVIVTCNDCNESFTSKVRLKFHMQFHDKTSLLTDGKYKCMQCEDHTFETETELFDHVHFRHEKKKRWQCPVRDCGKTFYLRATLTKHSRTHTDTRRYACLKCGKRFLDKQTLDEHGVTHLQIKPYQCHICLKQLTRVSRLRMHVRAHCARAAPARTHACTHCARAFRDHSAANEHALKSTECIEAFASQVKKEIEEPTVQLSPTSGLVRHTIQVIESPPVAARIPREVSDAAAEAMLAPLSDQARTIIRIVEIDKAFRCEYCEDVFYLEEGLNKHRDIHKGVKNPFTCHICKVRFATYSRCTTHKTTHGFYRKASRGEDVLGYGDFPVVKHFLCEDCGRSYLHWTYLQVHRRMKHPHRAFLYNCPDCDLTFPNSWSLAYHRKKFHSQTGQDECTVKISTPNYRIQCRDCDEILPNKNALYLHRKKNHSDMSLQSEPNISSSHNNRAGGAWWCGGCGRGFRGRAALRAHTRTAHPAHLAVIQMHASNPSTEDVINTVLQNDISEDQILEISYMTFLKGSTHIIPNNARALSLNGNIPKTLIPWTRDRRHDDNKEDIQPSPRSILPSRFPSILRPDLTRAQVTIERDT